MVRFPVGVNVPADCAIAIRTLLATPKKRSGIIRLVFMSRLQGSEEVAPLVKRLCM
jgi:hypothetical protein